jgi:hypothetical protein
VSEYFGPPHKERTDLNLLEKPGNVHNADKNGFPLNNKPPSKVLLKRVKNATSQTYVEGGEKFIILASRNAIGNFIPLQLFTGEKIPDRIFLRFS